ncbi:MAG: hypothetical protein Q8O41_09000 [Candidatus Methanoperedens sp.]|nr:hypothetical protein [Candidatus Methanoperedens sp.]
MRLKLLTAIAADKTKFKTLHNFCNFAEKYLEYISDKLQAVIVSQNENHYHFFQYGKAGGYQITRPINSRLMCTTADFLPLKKKVIGNLKNVKDFKSQEDRLAINRIVYTLQMSIGSALDALPAGRSNTARKIRGFFIC